MTAPAWPADLEDVARRLAAVLGAAWDESVDVIGLERLKGGYSRRMWSFEARRADGSVQALVLCADGPDGVVDVGAESLSRVQEATLLARLHEAGLAVPGIVCAGGPDSRFGTGFLVMERVEGTAAVGPLLREPAYIAQHGRFAEGLAGFLGALQREPLPAAVFGDSIVSPQAVVAAEVRRWEGALDRTAGARSPVLDDAVGWLSANELDPPGHMVIVHGDFRTGNVMYGPDGIHAVLDWEMAHPGDALEDVAWAALACWRVGSAKVGGIVAPERWWELCAAAIGETIEWHRLRYWRILSSVKITALMWRAADGLPPGGERTLLERLRLEVEDELVGLLAG